MNFAQRFIDLQIDEDIYKDLQEELDELGRRFDIQRSDVEFESSTEDDPETGETTVKITFKTDSDSIPRVKKPEEVRKNLRLITNDDDDDPGTMH